MTFVVRDSSLQPMFLKYNTGHFHDDKKIQDMPNSVAAENDLTPCFQNSDQCPQYEMHLTSQPSSRTKQKMLESIFFFNAGLDPFNVLTQ